MRRRDATRRPSAVTLWREVSMARSRKGSSAGAGTDRGTGKNRGAGDDRDDGDGRSIDETARDHLRAAVGGLFVGLPLLWTMETWEQGATLPPLKLLFLLGLAFAVVVGFTAVSGFRRERTWVELLVDAVHDMGLSIVVATAMLYLLGRLEPDLGLPTLVGRIGLLSIPVAFGCALAATVLSEPEEGGGREPVGPVGRLFVAAGGALYFALSVAPTDEVRVLGSEADVPMLLLVIIASLVSSLAIVFVVELPGGRGGSRSGSRGDGPIDQPVGETIAAYAIALLVSLVLISSFGLSDGLGLRALAGYVVVLGMLASFGSAAGRLLVGGRSGEGEGSAA
jgi:putative integral membrane protein (TIGR02587 family)